MYRVSPQGIVANVLDCNIVGRFKPQLHNHIHFWTNTLGKGIIHHHQLKVK